MTQWFNLMAMKGFWMNSDEIARSSTRRSYKNIQYWLCLFADHFLKIPQSETIAPVRNPSKWKCVRFLLPNLINEVKIVKVQSAHSIYSQ